ncbi:sporulation protein [Ammoniphilus sp. CFH 90114]|uniref:sporulation protein n=1 Tax=Ammoniphilus sp. CFH 90114 TaxID=2493665 RepID=UPI00100F67D8|nr:sporulation protein [Ammoniphilus sp. CFH 90114]RXT07975.1 sporulation protein [Ammoniphilus sp. CFH 90114]
MMSFFDKVKASIGIGAAKVDAKLDKNTYTAGENLTGTLLIQGGNIDQEINGIDLRLVTEVIKEVDDKKVKQNVSFMSHRAVSGFTIARGERKDLSFSFPIPMDTPITIGNSKIWLQTAMDISLAMDPTDRDFVTIRPHEAVQTVLEATQSLGFTLRKAENLPFGRSSIGLIQEFEFVPTSGAFRGKLDEIELVFFVQRDGIRVMMEIDRKARGLVSFLAESLDLDESKVSIFLPFQEVNRGVQATASRLHGVISSYC